MNPNRLIEEYGIPESDAIRLDHDLKVLAELMEGKKNKTIKYNNQDAIEIIYKSEPIIKEIEEDGITVAEITPLIKKVCFVIETDGKSDRIWIDDPSIIEKLRNAIGSQTVSADNYTHIELGEKIGRNKRKQGQQPNPHQLKEIILDILPYAKGKSIYENRIFVARILGEYMDSFYWSDKKKTSYSKEELHDKISSILNRS